MKGRDAYKSNAHEEDEREDDGHARLRCVSLRCLTLSPTWKPLVTGWELTMHFKSVIFFEGLSSMNCVESIHRSYSSPQILDALLLVGKVALSEEAEVTHRVVDSASTVEVAVLVVLLEDLVDRLLVQHAVVLQVPRQAIEFLQSELQLPVGLSPAHEAVCFPQIAEVIYLLLIEVDLLLALLQFGDVPGVHHVDVVGEFPIEGAFTRGERSLVDQLLPSPHIASWQDTLEENAPILRFPFFLRSYRIRTPTCMPVSSTTMLVDTDDDVE